MRRPTRVGNRHTSTTSVESDPREIRSIASSFEKLRMCLAPMVRHETRRRKLNHALRRVVHWRLR